MPSFAHQEINQDSGSKRTPPVPPIPLEIKQISERLVKIKNENSAEDASANEIIRRMKALRADLQDTLGSCHKTMETSSHCLEDYFRHIAPAQVKGNSLQPFQLLGFALVGSLHNLDRTNEG